jgi:hypothetical protein
MARSDEHDNLIRRVRLTAVFGLASALLALATGGVTLLFDLRPDLKPDPKEKVGASITIRALEENVQQRQFFKRTGVSIKAGCAPEQLARLGTIVYVETDIEGFKREETSLRWFTYDARNDTRVPYQRSRASEATLFKPGAPINQQIAQVWVPTPLTRGEYYIRFELYNAGVLLAFVDTEPFSVSVSPFESHDPPCRQHLE